MTDKEFDIILSKNRLAKTVRELYIDVGEPVPDHVLFDFSEIEKATGTANQPTTDDILNAKPRELQIY